MTLKNTMIARIRLIRNVIAGILSLCVFMASSLPVYSMTEEEMLLSKVNEERKIEGLGTLSMDPDLSIAAKIRAEESSKSFSHTRPDGSDCFTVSKDVNGENLAKICSYDSICTAIAMWKNSPSHKENMLWPTSTKTGIAIYKAEDGTVYIAEEFN